jgi:hypothetical protein
MLPEIVFNVAPDMPFRMELAKELLPTVHFMIMLGTALDVTSDTTWQTMPAPAKFQNAMFTIKMAIVKDVSLDIISFQTLASWLFQIVYSTKVTALAVHAKQDLISLMVHVSGLF